MWGSGVWRYEGKIALKDQVAITLSSCAHEHHSLVVQAQARVVMVGDKGWIPVFRAIYRDLNEEVDSDDTGSDAGGLNYVPFLSGC